MNLEMLGDHLIEMGDWPELHAKPYEGPVLWVAGADVTLRPAGIRCRHARAVPARSARHDQRSWPLGA